MSRQHPGNNKQNKPQPGVLAGLWHLELELGNGCATQRLDKRVEQAVGFETYRPGARDEAGRHDGSLAHYHHQPASATQMKLEALGSVGSTGRASCTENGCNEV